MANLASMTGLTSTQVAANPAVVAAAAAAASGAHQNLPNIPTSNVNRAQPNISAEQWQTAYSGVEQFVGKTVKQTVLSSA